MNFLLKIVVCENKNYLKFFYTFYVNHFYFIKTTAIIIIQSNFFVVFEKITN